MRKHLLALTAACALLPLVGGGEAQAQSGINLPGAPFIPSGISPVQNTLTAAGASSPFLPLAGRSFNIQLSGVASATCILERQLDGTIWLPIVAGSGGTVTILHDWTYTGAALSDSETETQSGVPYRVDCGAQAGSFTSGNLTIKLSQ